MKHKGIQCGASTAFQRLPLWSSVFIQLTEHYQRWYGMCLWSIPHLKGWNIQIPEFLNACRIPTYTWKTQNADETDCASCLAGASLRHHTPALTCLLPHQPPDEYIMCSYQSIHSYVYLSVYLYTNRYIGCFLRDVINYVLFSKLGWCTYLSCSTILLFNGLCAMLRLFSFFQS